MAGEPSSVIMSEAMAACQGFGRTDLLQRLRFADARLTRPSTLVCVVGEYKQGKSLLVNALVGRDVCPVDDDVATAAFTAVYGDDAPRARAHRSVEGHPVIEEIGLDAVAHLVSERGDAAGRAGLDLVEIGVPSDVLPKGLTLVDTPGVGGLLDQHAAATLRFLRLADAVLFVTDASQELTAPELEFLTRVHACGPDVVVVVTKIDLYPAWTTIVDLDRGHLRDRGLSLDPVAVSAVAHGAGHDRQLAELEDESGIPALRDHLVHEVMAGAKQRAADHAAVETRWVLQRLREPLAAELTVLQDPDRAGEAAERLRTAEARLGALQAGGARWSTVLNDGFSDLRADVDHRLRSGIRATLAELDERIEGIDPAEHWDDLCRWLQERLATLVDDVVCSIEARAESVNEQIAALLLAETPPSLPLDGGQTLGVEELWGASDRSLKARRGGLLASGLAALRGGSSGTILLGMVARFAGVALATPVSLGVAVAFGAKQVADVRKQDLSRRRQEARTVARRFVDEVSVEAGNRMHRLVQDLHRGVRDGYADRLQEMMRSAAAAVAGLRASLEADGRTRAERADRLRAWLEHLDALLGRLDTEDSP
jgi:hypothetical protein